MTTEDLIERVGALSPYELAAVAQFIDYLERRDTSTRSPFVQVAEQFMAEHPELLRRLAQ